MPYGIYVLDDRKLEKPHRVLENPSHLSWQRVELFLRGPFLKMSIWLLPQRGLCTRTDRDDS